MAHQSVRARIEVSMTEIGQQTEQRYRDRTAKKTILFTGTRICQGPCHKTRSVAQYAAGDTFCLQCRRRA
jgi:hypothetical protein